MTFAGYPAADGSAHDIAIVGAPCDLGATGLPGQRFAPESIRIAGEYDHNHFVDPMGYDYATASVRDHGDIEMVVGDYTQSLVEIERVLDGISKKRMKHAKANHLVLLGGDDGVNGPLCASLMTQYGRGVVVIHLDAHTDTYAPSEAKRRDHGTWVGNVITDGIVEHVHQFGVRAVAPSYKQQRKFLKNTTRHHYVDAPDPVGRAIEEMRGIATFNQYDTVLLAIDIDVVDPAYAPGVAFPEPGGLSSAEIRRIVRAMAPWVSAMSITEVTPALDPLGLTSQLANRLVLDYIFGVGTVTSTA